MTVVVAAYGTFMRLSGTIAEVLNEVVDQNISNASKIIYYAEATGNAVALVGRLI